MKMKVFLLSSAILSIAIASGFAAIYSGNSDIPLQKGVNEKGQSYGCGSDFGETPDLVAAVGIDGTLGYIYKTDMEPEFKTTEEALQWQEKRKDRKTIPLYSSDGETVIGEFEMYPAAILTEK